MYLLNRQQLQKHALDKNSQYLTIINFSPKHLQHTSYYFRVGRIYEIVHDDDENEIRKLTEKNRIITIHPNQYILVRTAEIFKLGPKVKAFVGSNGDSVSRGLLINYSPFIDPLYEGWLEIGVKNLLEFPVKIKMGERIGKLSFFDISDTYPIEIDEHSIQGSKFAERASLYELDDGVRYPEEEDDSDLYKKKGFE